LFLTAIGGAARVLPWQKTTGVASTTTPVTLPQLMAISKPSKSALKREFHALQELGEELIGLSPAQLESLRLEPDLLAAVLRAQGIKSHGALRRQKQLIGKLMRSEDPDPIRAAIRKFGSHDRLQKDAFRRAEKWRDRVIDEGPAALHEYFSKLERTNDELLALAQNYYSATGDKRKRELRRKIFREIHDDLTRLQRTGLD
jgi:ribosome-associated protein